MARARQPLDSSEGLALMNCLIKERGLQQALIDFKRKRASNDNVSDATLGEVGDE
jgi:hypothetical protein